MRCNYMRKEPQCARNTKRGEPQYLLFKQLKKNNKLKEPVDVIKKEFKNVNLTTININCPGDPTDFENKFKKIKNDFEYIWIGLSREDFVIVVGKSHTNFANTDFGDLFKEYKLPTTARFILDLEKGNDEVIKTWSLINGYIKKAIIIKFTKSSKFPTAHDLEKGIGNLLLDENVPILNKYSHNYGR